MVVGIYRHFFKHQINPGVHRHDSYMFYVHYLLIILLKSKGNNINEGK